MVGIDTSLTNIDAEAALLGCIISENELILKCIDSKIKPTDFSVKGFDFLYNTILELYKNKIPVEPVSLINEVKKAGGFIEASSITKMVISAISTNIDYYISEVKNMSYKRHVRDKLNQFISNLNFINASEIRVEFDDIVKSMKNYDSSENLYCDISEVQRTELNEGLQIGFSEIDELTNGLVYGSLTVLTGEPSAGKSTILNQIIAQNLSSNHKALIYSGELTSFNVLQWFMRTVANPSDLKEFSGINGIYYDVSSSGEHLIRQWIKDRLFLFNEDSIADISNITNAIECLAKEKDIKLVVIDNMMTVENSEDEEIEKQKKLAKKLKSLARKYKLCIILVAHPKKKERKEKYHMHDVSGASEVVNLADYEFLLTRDIKNNEDITRFIILKNRITGKQGIIRVLKFDEIRKRFWINVDERNRNYNYDQIQQISFKKMNAEETPF